MSVSRWYVNAATGAKVNFATDFPGGVASVDVIEITKDAAGELFRAQFARAGVAVPVPALTAASQAQSAAAVPAARGKPVVAPPDVHAEDVAGLATDAELAAAQALKQDVASDPGSVIAAATLSTSYVLTIGFAAVPGWQIVVPANSGIVDVEVAEPMLVNINTGTNAAGTKFSLQMRITDEAGAVVAYSQKAIYSSAATSQVWADTVSLKKQVPNNPAAKTYKVEALMDHVGIAGGASTLFTSQSGFTDPTLRAVRR